MPGRRSKRKYRSDPRGAQPGPNRARSGFFLLDIVDDLGHVILILAEFGGVLDQLFFFLLGFFDRDAGLVLFLDRLDLLGLGIALDAARADRLAFLLHRS